MNHHSIIERYLPQYPDCVVHGNLIAYEVPEQNLVSTVETLYRQEKLPLKLITAMDERATSGSFRILYLFGIPKESIFLAPFIRVQEKFPSLTPAIHEASLYERKIKTFFGLNPVGHPDPRSLILHENWPEGVYPLRKDFAWNSRPEWGRSPFEFRQLQGEGIYEIPVGPVHAGIIEPGHFRFSVAGEEIILLEPRLGYSHKGSEKLFEALPLADKLRLAERISGDSSFSHALAFCQAVESLGDVKIAEADAYLRVIFAELERLANHFGDLGAIMTDTGYNFGGANGARLREIVMQLNERLAGSRFLRGVLQLGGVKLKLSHENRQELARALDQLQTDFSAVVAIAENSSTLMNRLENTGTLDRKIAEDHGVVGVAARSVGLRMDARVDYPYAAYDKLSVDIAIEQDGDVHARYAVRRKEVYSSFDVLKHALRKLPDAQATAPQTTCELRKNSLAIGIVEGWRGDIVHFVATDDKGEITRVDVRDPSFLNWSVLGHAGRENVVPDFPLINKSFNLSYSGNDL